ncbi:solute carrier family 22 member 5-like [Venturia canescens]|uniref:solute carrier family 22 member 5-like n=1 Tax=Venturia canescens TaxID=32260 RepID=UPI001C9C7AA0|nr:solute carrier family 22 member 5-like [Venturia canescens]XP_043267860.1 solute carrier family 22 member 5-like [Venturia canescens]XP_043267861.1 solute carrier family 22 member 5-like [Venturia canescens]XP_043267863.1 solute carrier family 22 member 5-like [Venturia canescens]XP_043267864.1 solute carrier family 22 member 5-like [Venturia canescens]XP_043267865.1 solute carrier family 22 member 5-like [Venturia canescens]
MTRASLKPEDQCLQDEETRQQAIREIDAIGLYQVTMYFIIGIPLILSAAYSMGYTFTAGEVDYRCFVPECENSTHSELYPEWIDDAIPKTNRKFESCTRYAVRDSTNGSSTCSASSFTMEKQRCDAWVYDPSERTILNEWDITCDENRWKLAMVGTANNIGQLIGMIFAGYISDRFGRRTVLTILTTISGVLGIIQSFSVNYWMFLSFEFLQACASSGMYSSGYILGVEMVGEKRRVLGGAVISSWFGMGGVILGAATMWLRSWQSQLRLFYITGVLVIFLPTLVPESKRWLVANGRMADVEKIHKKMAKMNGFKVDQAKLDIYKELSYSSVRKETRKVQSVEGVLTLKALQRPVLVVRLLACCLCWLTNTFVYYGLSLNSVAIAGDKYTNFMLATIIDTPANFLGCYLLNRLGRKPTLSAAFLCSGTFCLLIQFVPAGTSYVIPLLLFLGGKGCISMAFSSSYVYTSEMFPTTARHSLLAICSMTGRIGSILAPQTILLSSVMESLPLILFGSMGILAGTASLLFPETLGCKLPDTIAEAENIGKPLPTKQSPNIVA